MTLKWKRANKQKQQTNGNRAIWFVYRTDTNARGFWLVKRTLGWKNFMPKNFLEINRCFALKSTTRMANRTMPSVYIRVILFSGKTKSPCFDLFIHWLIKQITNTYRNNFSRSYENRSIFETAYCIFYFFRVHTIETTNWVNPLNETTSIWNYSPEWFEATSIRIRVKKLLGFKNVWILVDRT